MRGCQEKKSMRSGYSGLHKVYSVGPDYGVRYLLDCLETAAEKAGGDSFGTLAFAVIPDEQLYGVLLAQWHPPCPATQAQAFTRIESAYYAAMLPLDHHLPRCIELLVGVRPPAVNGNPKRTMTGYLDDPVAAANKHLVAAANEYQARRLETGFPDPDRVAASNEQQARRLETGFPDPDPAPAASAATDEPPEAKTIVDLDQALSYLHRACSLTTLAVKHLDVAVAFISSLLDPEEVAKISEWTDEHVYISEEAIYIDACVLVLAFSFDDGYFTKEQYSELGRSFELGRYSEPALKMS